MSVDLRGTQTWRAVSEHFDRVHGPVLGRPHRIVEVACSQDGLQHAVTGLVYDELVGLPRQAVYLVRDRELTCVSGAVGSARCAGFSPDGASLAFLTDAAVQGRFQLALVSLAGLGEQLSTPVIQGTAEYAKWSPDGTQILIGVAGLGADLSGGQGSGRTAKPADDLPEWHPRVEAGVAEEAWRSVWVYDVASKTVALRSPENINVWEATWLGSEEVLAVTSPSPEESAWYSASLCALNPSGSVTEIAVTDVQFGWPAGSPDGTRFAVVQAICSDRWVVAGDLLVGRIGDTPTHVDTLGIDISATHWIDDDRLGLLGIRGLETVAAIYDLRSEKLEEVWASTQTSCGTRHPEGTWTADGRLVVIEEGYSLPQQVVSIDSVDRTVLASIANDGSDYVLSVVGSAEAVAWSAPDGLRIEGLLCKPEGVGPFPLVINIHGGPVWSFRSLWSMFYASTPVLVANGYAVLNPNPRGSSGRGQEFAAQVFGEMGGADTYDFTSAVDALVERGIVDPDRVGLMGGSYGGFMSAWLVTQDQRWAAAVPVSPVTNWYSQHFTSNIPTFDALFLAGDPEIPGDKFHLRSPVMQAKNVRTPCLNIAGALDRCTPPTQAQEFHQALLECGVDSQLVIYPQEGHGVRAFPALIDYSTRVLDWFKTYMPPNAGKPAHN